MNKDSLLNKIVEITDTAEWGVVKNIEDGDYYIAMFGNDSEQRIFSREEIKL